MIAIRNYHYCPGCNKVREVSERNSHSVFSQVTERIENYFFCKVCGKMIPMKQPVYFTRHKLLMAFKDCKIIKDSKESNISTLYPIYWHIWKNDDYVYSYGTGDEQNFWKVIYF